MRDSEKQYIASAVDKGAGKAITIVDTKSGEKKGVSIIQTNKLPEFPISLLLNENVASKLIEIFAENQNREIPFYICAKLDMSGTSGLPVICDSINVPQNSISNQYDCQHTTEDALKSCNEIEKQISNSEDRGVLLIGHNHPVVNCNREHNLQISNNFSTQDIEGVERSINYNININRPKNIFTMSIMVNHIGGISVIFIFKDKYYKVTNIKVKCGEKIIDVKDYIHPTLNKGMTVFDNPENYEIEQTEENKKLIADIVSEIKENSSGLQV